MPRIAEGAARPDLHRLLHSRVAVPLFCFEIPTMTIALYAVRSTLLLIQTNAYGVDRLLAATDVVMMGKSQSSSTGGETAIIAKMATKPTAVKLQTTRKTIAIGLELVDPVKRVILHW